MTDFQLHETADQRAFYQLYLYAFGKKDDARRREFFNLRYAHAIPYGIKENGQLVSGLYRLPFTVNLGGAKFRMDGIGDVMSAPEFGGRGGASQLMRAAVTDMNRDGVPLSYLAPFSYGYYRKFGYEHVFTHTVFRLASRDVPRLNFPPIGTIRRGTLTELLPEVTSLYANNAAKTHGGLERPSWWWHYLTVKNNWDTAVYADDNGQPSGYVIYERTPTALRVVETITETRTARQQLLALVLRHANTFPELVYEAPNMTTSTSPLPDPAAIHTTTQPYMMARIVNLRKFTTRYPAQKDGKLVIALHDDTLPENTGNWRFVSKNGQLTCTPSTEAANLQLTIQQLTQIMLGSQSTANLNRWANIENTQGACATLDGIRLSHAPALVDYF